MTTLPSLYIGDTVKINLNHWLGSPGGGCLHGIDVDEGMLRYHGRVMTVSAIVPSASTFGGMFRDLAPTVDVMYRLKGVRFGLGFCACMLELIPPTPPPPPLGLDIGVVMENPRRPSLLETYQIPFRNIAEAAWGRGGTQSHRTTRPGFRYYSCSGHGGYVVDGRSLTTDEKLALDDHDFEPEMLPVLVQSVTATSPKYVIGADMSPFSRYSRRRKWRYDVTKGEVEWHDIPVYLFEEDCDWALVEWVTGVRLVEQTTPSEHDAAVEETYKRWHSQRKKSLVATPDLGGAVVMENPE